jgi:predicted RND superfamily exporter protein
MERYVAVLDRFKWLIVTLIPLLILLFATVLKDMAFEGGYRIWFAEGSQVLGDYDRFKEHFGSDDVIVVAFEDNEGIFNPKPMETIKRLTEQLGRLPYIDSVLSLGNVTYIGNTSEVLPLYGHDYERMRITALAEPTIHRVLISSDATATMIAVKVAKDARDGEDRSFEIRDAVKQTVDEEAGRSGYRFHINGAIPLQTGFIDIMIAELVLFIPLIAMSVAVLLFVIFRRVSGVIVPMAVVGLSILCVMSLLVALGYKTNNFTADLPVFVLAIGIAATVHVYTTWQHRINEGDDTKEAVLYSLRKNMLAVFLTSLTTAIGFASLSVSTIVPVYTLGLSTAGGVVMVFVLCMVVIPAMLMLIEPKQLRVRKRFVSTEGYGRFILQNNSRIVVGTMIIFILFGLGLTRLQIDSNLIHFLDDDVEVREATEFVMAELTGPMSYEIVVDSGREDGIVWPRFMSDVAIFSQAFVFAFDEVRHVASPVNVVQAYYKVEYPDKKSSHSIPGSPTKVAEYLDRYSKAQKRSDESVDEYNRYLWIHVQTDMTFSKRDLEMIAWIEQWWERNSGYSARVYGQTAMFAHMQADITDTLLWSIGMSITLVSLVMLAIFRKLRLLYVYILPNLLPFLLVLGVMGWSDINVDLGVAISGAVILGIAVDDTMHFLVKYFDGRKQGLDMEAALDYVMAHSGQAIMITTLILSTSFLMLMTSDFIPNANFGIVTASALLIAVIVDLLFLPALLSLVDRDSGESRKMREKV